MKRLIIAFMLVGITGITYAGDKEELQLKQAVLQERIGRLQAEYALTQYQIKEFEEQKKVVEQKGNGVKK